MYLYSYTVYYTPPPHTIRTWGLSKMQETNIMCIYSHTHMHVFPHTHTDTHTHTQDVVLAQKMPEIKIMLFGRSATRTHIDVDM
jgi:hypothetical protein